MSLDLNTLLNEPIVPNFFTSDTTIPQSVALSHVDPFIQDLNGGTVPSFDPNTPSEDNNFAIIDFLLLLEMVETAFYQVNGEIIALILPAHVGIALALWRQGVWPVRGGASS